MLHKTHLEIKGTLCVLWGKKQNVLNTSGYFITFGDMLCWSSKQERLNKTLQDDRFQNIESTDFNFLFIAQVKLMVENMIVFFLAEKMTDFQQNLSVCICAVEWGWGRKMRNIEEAFGDISKIFLK